jgi:lambda family phage portal protein
MWKIIENITGFLGPNGRSNGRLPGVKSGKRAYEAGRITRHSSDWMPDSRSINRDIRDGGRRVRSRSKDLRQNNPYANGYRISNRSNIVGHEGFKLQVRSRLKSGEYDDVSNRLIEDGFEEWTEPEYATMTGRLPFILVQWLVSEQMKFEGEFLVRKIENLDPNINKFGFSLELLDPDDLDENYYADLGNGHVVVNGIEIDEWRRIYAFYFNKGGIKDELTGSYGSLYSSRRRIDASEIIYGFDPEHVKQLRGMTKLSAVMISLKGVDRWEDASLINATTSAQKMGFLEDTVENAEGYTGSKRYSTDGKEDTDTDGGKYADFEAGIIEELPYGKKFSAFDPKFPHEQHQPFLKSMLRKIATGLGLSYNSFANDLEGVNFSSMRSGLLTERDNWMCEQTLFKLLFLKQVYKAWLKNALRTKAVNLPYANYNNYVKHFWQGRRWPWVDPRADVEANILAAKAGFKPPSLIISEMGGDIEDTYKAYSRDTKLQDKYGLKFDLSTSIQFKDANAQGANADAADNSNRNLKIAS